MTDEQKIKVSELPEDEQKALIQEAYSLGISGILTGWKVETLKKKIEGEKAKRQADGEQTDGDNEQVEEPKSEETEQTDTEAEQTDDEVKEEPTTEETPQEPKQEPKEKPKTNVFNGICHICGSKVIDGVCTGCKFIR